MGESRRIQSRTKSGIHLLNAFPTSEKIRLQRPNFKHPKCLSPLIARWNICNAHTKKTGSLMPTSSQDPPQNSLLLLLTARPEALPETIVSRCLSLPLRTASEIVPSPQEMELLRLLCATAAEKSRGIEGAYRVSQGIQALLNSIREQIRDEHAAALKREETRYRHTTDGGWLSERDDY